MTPSLSQTKALITHALSARAHAYAPYSHFSVGAAVLAADGRIFSGCNVENAAYPAGICAERCAIGAAITAGVREFQAIAIVGSGRNYTTPCGICRQVLQEFHMPLVICGRAAEDYIIIQGDELLPHAFEAANLT